MIWNNLPKVPVRTMRAHIPQAQVFVGYVLQPIILRYIVAENIAKVSNDSRIVLETITVVSPCVY